ncbi:MAG: hypothetical protein ACKO50_12720 [Cyanobium sp.]
MATAIPGTIFATELERFCGNGGAELQPAVAQQAFNQPLPQMQNHGQLAFDTWPQVPAPAAPTID